MNAEDLNVTYIVLTSGNDVVEELHTDRFGENAKELLHAYAVHANISANHHEQTAKDHIQDRIHAAPACTLIRLKSTSRFIHLLLPL